MELNKNKRRKAWFKAGYVIMDMYTKIIGPLPALIYLFIKSYEHHNTRYSWPSEELIAEKLSICTQSVKRGIKKLEVHHFVITEKIKEKGRWPSNLYYLTQSRDWRVTPCDSQSHSKKYPQGDIETKPG